MFHAEAGYGDTLAEQECLSLNGDRMKNTLAKVWIAMAVLACTYACLIFWGAKSYRESAAAVQNIVQPDLAGNQIHELHKSIVQTDLHFQHFILTNDSLQWELARDNRVKTDSLLNILYASAAEWPWLNTSLLDSLRFALSEKTRTGARLFSLKQKGNSIFFTREALRRIQRQLSDSAYVEKAIVRKLDFIPRRDTVEHIDLVKKPDEFRGVGGFFRRLFGKPKIRIDTVRNVEEQMGYTLEVAIDSSIVRDYFVDSTLAVVRNILTRLMEEEIQLLSALYMTELELIYTNERLLQNIQKLLQSMERSSMMAMHEDQERAKRTLENANLRMLWISGIGLVLGIILLLMLFKDISLTNIYRQKLEKEKQRAEQLAAARELFLSSMSHEIRTPLHSIAGFSELLYPLLEDRTKQQYLSGIIHANQYLNVLIGNILEQAKINTGRFRLENRLLHVPELCRETEMLFRFQKMENNNRFQAVYVPELENQQMELDVIKLKQVLINLLHNAFKFTQNGEVQLRFDLKTENQTRWLYIEVKDTGTGIPKEQLERLFRPFQRGTRNQLPVPGSGTGLGLSISKHIIEHFGGNLSVHSEPGEGTCFSIQIPVTVKTGEKNLAESHAGALGNFYFPLRIIAIEDDRWNALLLAAFLESRVDSLEHFSTAGEALEVFKKNPENFDLLITDLNLPDLHGTEVLKEVRKISSLPVFAMSAGLFKKDEHALLKIGFSASIGKPFGQNELMDMIVRQFPDRIEIREKKEKGRAEDLLSDPKWEAIFKESLKEKLEQFHLAIGKNPVELGRMAHQLKSNLEQSGIKHFTESLQSIELYVTLQKNEEAFRLGEKIWPELKKVLE